MTFLNYRLCLAVLAATGTFAQSATLPTEVTSLVERLAIAHMQTQIAGGISIGVLKDGVSYTWNHGAVAQGKGPTPNSLTVYPIASITKTFTGTLLAEAALRTKSAWTMTSVNTWMGNTPTLLIRATRSGWLT